MTLYDIAYDVPIHLEAEDIETRLEVLLKMANDKSLKMSNTDIAMAMNELFSKLVYPKGRKYLRANVLKDICNWIFNTWSSEEDYIYSISPLYVYTKLVTDVPEFDSRFKELLANDNPKIRKEVQGTIDLINSKSFQCEVIWRKIYEHRINFFTQSQLPADGKLVVFQEIQELYEHCDNYLHIQVQSELCIQKINEFLDSWKSSKDIMNDVWVKNLLGLLDELIEVLARAA